MNRLTEFGLISTILIGCATPPHRPDKAKTQPILDLAPLCPTPTQVPEFPCIAPDGTRVAVGERFAIKLSTKNGQYKLDLTCRGSTETANGARLSIFETNRATFDSTGASGITTIFDPSRPGNSLILMCKISDNCIINGLSVPQPPSTPIPRESMTGRTC